MMNYTKFDENLYIETLLFIVRIEFRFSFSFPFIIIFH